MYIYLYIGAKVNNIEQYYRYIEWHTLQLQFSVFSLQCATQLFHCIPWVFKLTKFYFQMKSINLLKRYTFAFRVGPKWTYFVKSSIHTDNPKSSPVDPFLANSLCSKILPFQNIISHYENSISLFAKDHDLDRLQNNLQKLRKSTELESKLQTLLKVNYDNYGNFYDTKWHFDKHYFQKKDPLFLFSNCAVSYPDMGLRDKQLSKNFLEDYISSLILSVIDYSANNKKFSVRHRKPTIDKDDLIETDSNMIAISCGCKYYIVDLTNILQPNEMFPILKKVLRFIVNDKPKEGVNEFPIGILSTLPRLDCVYGYRFLNQTSLDLVLQAKLLVSIEQVDNYESQNLEDHLTSISKHLLQSDVCNIGNRWLDKSMQMVVITNYSFDRVFGTGICYERSLFNASTAVDLVQHSVAFISKFKVVHF